ELRTCLFQNSAAFGVFGVEWLNGAIRQRISVHSRMMAQDIFRILSIAFIKESKGEAERQVN
uniref:Uncharacterized protein n=1 Tax=Amphimedon queenslandica TaxID=400682 RepID=A0A1X7U4W2_AMPQE